MRWSSFCRSRRLANDANVTCLFGSCFWWESTLLFLELHLCGRDLKQKAGNPVPGRGLIVDNQKSDVGTGIVGTVGAGKILMEVPGSNSAFVTTDGRHR